MNLVQLSYKIAENGHKGQFRRGGLPYIFHPKEVSKNIKKIIDSYYAVEHDRLHIFQSVALLHDLVEDNKDYNFLRIEVELSVAENITKKDLGDVIDALKAITKQDGEFYFNYLQRVKVNQVARLVKITDIEHNLSDSPKPNKIDLYKLAKYFLEN